MIKIAHIVNPVNVPQTSDLYIAQPITFETMRRAQVNSPENVEVTLYTTQYPEDHAVLPTGFIHLPDLERAVTDVATFQIPRKLPLLKDILDKLYAASDAEYFVYTNADIALMPQFYEAIANMLQAGHDAIVINRRTIPNHYTSVDDIALMQTELGKSHNGHDCFVFKRSAYEHYYLGNTCLGTALIDSILIWNMILNSENFLHYKRRHFTFHIGDDRLWDNPQYQDYRDHNRHEGMTVLENLEKKHSDLYANKKLAPYLPKINENPLRKMLRRYIYLTISKVRKITSDGLE